MTTHKQALFICIPCRAQTTHDVPASGPTPVRACLHCGTVLRRTLPSLARYHFKQADTEDARLAALAATAPAVTQ